MRFRLPSFARPRSTVALLVCALLAIAPLQVGALYLRRVARPATGQSASGPKGSGAVPSVEPSVRHTRKAVAARTKPKPRKASRRAAPFAGLGAWIDVYDFEAVAPAAAVAVMRAHGVRTLYIQTGRYNTDDAVAPEVGPWLRAAHAAGLKVVGWYLPGYANLALDVDRSVAVARYRTAGEGFDGLGVDIEEKGLVRNVSRWNRHVISQIRAVRARTKDFPLAAITPTPIGMRVAPARWAGFPWQELARSSDALMLMSYWSYRAHCPEIPEQCAYGYTVGNIRAARALTGAPKLPIHIIGGVADLISVTDVADFVRAARNAGADGASLYDFRTTNAAFWALLERLA